MKIRTFTNKQYNERWAKCGPIWESGYECGCSLCYQHSVCFDALWELPKEQSPMEALLTAGIPKRDAKRYLEMCEDLGMP